VATKVSVPAFRGVLVPAALATWDNLAANTGEDDGSYWTAADPRPGGMTPDDPWSDFRAEISNAQDRDITTVMRAGGFPAGPDTDGQGARVAYGYPEDTQVDGGDWPGPDGDGDLRGWNPPTAVTGYVHLDTHGVGIPACPSACVVPSSQLVVVASVDETADRIKVVTWDPYTNAAGTTYTVATASTSSGNDRVAIVCVPGSERLVVYGQDAHGYTAYFSEDSGATWDPYAFDVLKAPAADIMAAPTRKKAFISPVTGDWGLWFMENQAAQQFNSTDAGASFTDVNAGDVDFAGGDWPPDVIMTRTGRVIFLRGDPTTGAALIRVLASNADLLSAATDVTLADPTSITSDYGWLVEDWDGVIYAMILQNGTDAIKTFASDDNGDTWEMCDHGPLRGAADAAAMAMTPGTLVAAAGACHFVHGINIGPTGSRVITTCGGWSNVVMAEDTDGGPGTSTNPDTRRVGYGVHAGSGAGGSAESGVWLPWETPNLAGWTMAGAGTQSLASNANGADLLVTTTAGQNKTYEFDFVGPDDIQGILAHAVLTPVSGGSATQPDIGFQLVISDLVATRAFGINVSVTTTAVQVQDYAGAADIGSPWTFTAGQTIEIKAGIRQFTSDNDHHVEVFARVYGTTAWVLVTEANAGDLTDGGAGDTARVVWGNIAGGAGSAKWRMMTYYGQADTAEDRWRLWQGSPSPAIGAGSDQGHWPVIGRPAAAIPYPLGDARAHPNGGTVTGAPFVRGVGGPARFGERFANAVGYGYGPDRLFSEVFPSPSDGWQSITGASTTDMWFSFVLPSDNARTLGSYSVGVAFEKINFRYAKLQEWTGAAWATLGTFDAAIGGLSTLKWTRTGDMITVTSTSPAGDRYIAEGELIGGTFDLDGTIRRIADNSPGVWSDGVTMQITIRLEGVTGSEGASGTAGSIWCPRGVLIVHKAETPRTRWRVLIEAQDTADDTFQCGKLIMGGFVPFGKQWSRGYAMDADPNVNISEDARGTTHVDVKGDVRRSWTVSWVDGLLTRGTQGTAPVPDYLASSTASTGKALAGYNDVATLALGVLAKLRGKACVLLRSVPTSDAATYSITDRNLFLYSRLISSLRVEHIDGPEERGGWAAGAPALRPAGELLRVSPLTWQEIV
jgi:hypothetical protein